MSEEKVIDQFVVLCEVSGGVTGYRQGLLREKGQTKLFPTMQAAEEEASKLRVSMGGGHSLATFRYRAMSAREACGA